MSRDLSQSGGQNLDNHRTQAAGNVHVKDLGFTLLSAGNSPEADIFFIHGLQGHPRNTWTYVGSHFKDLGVEMDEPRRSFGHKIGTIFKRHHKQPSQAFEGLAEDKSVFWPLDLLPTDFPNARIFTYGYDSHVTHWFKGPAMRLDVFSYGESLLNGLEARRREFPNRPLIFIVHSLGGLVLKDALRRSRSSNEERFKRIYLSTNAIFFLGTPHRGGNYVNLGLTARKILICSGFDANDKVLLDLKLDSSTAKLLSEEFSKILDEIRPNVYSFQEATGLSGFGPLSGKVVEDSSSALDYSREIKDVIHANHVNMCRFWGADDDGYEKVKSALSYCLSRDFVIGTHNSEHGFYQRVLSTLYLPDSQERFDQVEEAYEGTFSWIFEKDELGFVNWLQSGSGIFWISGKPASGKSTLLKYVASHPLTRELLKTNNPGNQWIYGEFFFTNRGKLTQKNLNGLFQRILYQLLSQCPRLLQFVGRIFKENVDGAWLFLYLEEALMTIVKQQKVGVNICFFIDALDEHSNQYYEDYSRLVRLLKQLVENSDGRIVRILLCLTSRPETVFQGGFYDCPGFPIHEHTHNDIKTYVYGFMGKCLQSRPDLTDDAQIMASLDATFKEVIRRAQGVFLWVKLVVTDFTEGLMDGDTADTFREILIAIPGDGDLQELYRGILLRLRPKYLLEAFFMLHLAFAATEPMPLKSFFQALKITSHGNLNYDWSVPTEIEMHRQLTSRCRGFLEVQQSFTTDELGSEYQGPIVQFLHQSVKDFLQDQSSFKHILKKLLPKFPMIKRLLSENGYAYLLRFRIHEHLQKYGDQPDIIKRHTMFNLRKFDVFYMAYMAEMTLGNTNVSALNALSDFADENGLVPFYMRYASWHVPPLWKPTFLVFAAQAGLMLYVQYCLERRVNIRAMTGRPLLHYAVLPMPESLSTRMTDPFLRSSKMIQLLVRLGADLEAQFEGLTAFGYLFMEDRGNRGKVPDQTRSVLQTLLQLGAETELLIPSTHSIQSCDTQGQAPPSIQVWATPLQIAVHRDDLQLSSLLLQFNAQIEALTEDDWKFLRKGYLYNEPPEFSDRPDQTAQEQLDRWRNEKEKCIKEGLNTKPMLLLIEKYTSGALLAVPTIRRSSSAQYTHSRSTYSQGSKDRNHQESSPRGSNSNLSYPIPQDSFGGDWANPRSTPSRAAATHRQDSFLSTSEGPVNERLRGRNGNSMLSVSRDSNILRRSASVGQSVESLEIRRFPVPVDSLIPPPKYSPHRPRQDELFF